MVVKEASYETSEPTVDSQIIDLQSSGADTFVIAATPKFAAQAIRKAYDVGWKPVRIPDQRFDLRRLRAEAGRAREMRRRDHRRLRQGADRPEMEGRSGPADLARLHEQIHAGRQTRPTTTITYGYGAAATMVQVLKQCGADLSRERIMKEAANLKDFQLPTLLPGMKINTSPTNYNPIRQMQLARFTARAGSCSEN